MKPQIYGLLLIALLLGACAPVGESYSPSMLPTASRPSGAFLSVSGETPTQTPTPSPNAVETARMVIVYDAATSTAAAAATGTSVAVTTTSEAKATEAFWVGVTFAVATEQRIETKVAQTQIAGTQQSAGQTAIPLTQTPLAATQQLESDKLQAERVSLWIYRVGFALFVVALLAVFVIVLVKGIPIAQEAGNAKVMRMKTEALKPDEHGRRPAVPSSTLKPGEKLLIPELAHRSALGVEGDDLTPGQALSNAGDYRKLEAIRSLSESPVMPRLLTRVADAMAKQIMPQATGSVSLGTVPQPDHALLTMDSMPALPTPHYKTLFGWDGQLLPYGVDEGGQLMRVDPTRNPHLMIAGGTGSGKTRSAIRTLVSGALASGWNVVVVAKRVDFLPFEDHPNIKILAVDVRKESGRYADILRVLTAQMDVRDNLMAARHISTWDRYGGPQTLIVLDDFTGAMMRMPSAAAKEVLNEAKQIAMDGRKFGLNLVLGLQRATWTSIDTDLRSQMGRIVFRVASAGDSRVALDEAGAERLPFLNYLTRLNDEADIQRGVGFFLQDPEVEAFLRSRPVKQNEAQDWIEGTASSAEAETQTEDINPRRVGDDARIRGMYLDYLSRQEKPSLRAIETAVFGKTGGSYHNAVKAAIADLEGCQPDDVASVIAKHVEAWGATSPGATTGDLPDFEPLPA